MSGLPALRASMRARRLLFGRRLWSELAQGRARAAGIVAVGLLVAVCVFGVGLGGGFYVVWRGAPELVKTGTSAILLALSAALVLSSLGHAAQAFFSAKDLWFWDSTPAPSWTRFLDRLVETAVHALPPTLALGALGIVGIALGSGLGVLAAVRGIVAVILIGVVPLSLGVILAHAGGAVLPAGKLRRLSLVFLGVFVAAALVWFRRARVEKALSPEGAAEVLASARSVKELGPAALPSSLGGTFVVEGDGPALVGLVVWVGAALLAAFSAHVLLARRARDLAVDESPVGLVRGSLGERALAFVVRPLPRSVRPMVEKDLLAFLRDPSQWGQVVLLLGVGALYLVNADALREGFRHMPEIGAAVLPAMHTGLVCFIASGLAVRFGFPQIGMEGPAVWIVDGSPMDARELLRAKWIAALPIVVVFPTSVGAVGGFVLQLKPVLWLITTSTCAAVSAGVAAFAVGRGALKPLFDATSLSELAIGPGAISTMMISVAVSFCGSLGAMFAGIAVIASVYRELSSALGFVIALATCAVPSLVALHLGRRALDAGARAFVRRREDEAERAWLAAHVDGPIAADE